MNIEPLSKKGHILCDGVRRYILCKGVYLVCNDPCLETFIGMNVTRLGSISPCTLYPNLKETELVLPTIEVEDEEESRWFLYEMNVSSYRHPIPIIPTTTIKEVSVIWRSAGESHNLYFAVHPQKGIVSCLKLPLWDGVSAYLDYAKGSRYVNEWRFRIAGKYTYLNDGATNDEIL